ncbi:hypothetical protein [Ideonella sp.]|uniref:hypothetical protein n=1 Tax=Ideonella sp. TaxID=1929293 RepID=UPI0035B375B6
MKTRTPQDVAKAAQRRAAAEPESAQRAPQVAGGRPPPFADSPRMVAQRQALAHLTAAEHAANDTGQAAAIAESQSSAPVQRMPKRNKQPRGRGGAGRGGNRGNRGGRGGRGGGGRGGVNLPQAAYQALKQQIDNIREVKTNEQRGALTAEQLEENIGHLESSIQSREDEDARLGDRKHARWTNHERRLLRQLEKERNRRRGGGGGGGARRQGRGGGRGGARGRGRR